MKPPRMLRLCSSVAQRENGHFWLSRLAAGQETGWNDALRLVGEPYRPWQTYVYRDAYIKAADSLCCHLLFPLSHPRSLPPKAFSHPSVPAQTHLPNSIIKSHFIHILHETPSMGLNQAELPNGVASPERRRHAKEDETSECTFLFLRSCLMANWSFVATKTTAPSFRPYFDTLLQRSSDAFVRTLRTQPVEAFANNPGSGTSSAGPSSKNASIFSGHATTSTYPTQYTTEYSLPGPKPAGHATSTINATDGSGSTTSSDDIEYVWDSGDRSNQFNCANDKVPGRHKKRRLREVVLHQGKLVLSYLTANATNSI
jgi:hypothetical protein